MAKKVTEEQKMTINPITKVEGMVYRFGGKKFKEEFKFIYLYGRYYLLSSCGQLWRSVENCQDSKDWDKLSFALTNEQKVYTLRDITNTPKKVRGHRLVAQFFMPKTDVDNTFERDLISFRNGNKLDSFPENMMWVNQAEANYIVIHNEWIKANKKVSVYESPAIVLFFKNTKYNYTPAVVRDILQIKDPTATNELKKVKMRVKRAAAKK